MTKRHLPKDGKPKPVTIHDEGLARDHKSILCALRLTCMSYAEPASLAWEGAVEICERDFGTERGPAIALTVMKCLKTLRMVRTGGFNFINPACPCCREKLSDHELAFMRLLAAERARDGIARQTQLLVLCEGADATALLGHIERLACLMEKTSRRPEGPAGLKKRIRFRFSS